MFHVADFEAVRRGEATDEYFVRTRKILEEEGLDVKVRAEFMAKSLPQDRGWGVLAGLEEVFNLLAGEDLKLRAMPEGQLFRPYEPVLEIEGRYLDFGRLETALLGLLCQASGVATAAAGCRLAAGEKTLFSFGARRMHPAIAPMLERNAFIGGCDGVAVGLGAALTGRPAVGTMPHALILIMGDTVAAAQAFDRVIDPSVKRIVLADTFLDEKFEALRTAEAMGDRLWGLRLDTPGSRRGDFARIIEEVRWELDLMGRSDVRIFVSGGLDEEAVRALAPLVDGFGVGTAVSNAPVVDFSMDLVEIDGRAVSKRGKMSGPKDVYRCRGCADGAIVPLGRRPPVCSCGGEYESLPAPPPQTQPSAEAVRNRVLAQLDRLAAQGKK